MLNRRRDIAFRRALECSIGLCIGWPPSTSAHNMLGTTRG
jgi:hypothetical protein